MWVQAGQAIKEASKIVCMGYSLPTGDLTMAQFIRSSAPANRIPFEIVDVSPKSDHFASVIGGKVYEFQQSGIDKDCIPRFVVQQCVPNEKDKAFVTQMTQWEKPGGELKSVVDVSK